MKNFKSNRTSLLRGEKMDNKTYTICCPECGVVTNNQSQVYCDKCKSPIEMIKLGCLWYNTEELEKDNPFT